tara:strand:+ start:443 stop:601 length:159 start_codon:yes stop_codon:yes gene_type:complete
MKEPQINNIIKPDPYEDIIKLEKLDPYESLIKLDFIHKQNKKAPFLGKGLFY